ncbi:MAG: TatD family hydrolase, partial [Spirochaetia bacterium]|nr:TatD family hydrolase [Spirochaetia bacterium]
MYIDSHAHFDLVCKEGGFAEDEVLDSMAERRVSRAVQISVDVSNFEWCRGFAARNRHRGIFFTTGIHPSSQMDESCLDAMSK